MMQLPLQIRNRYPGLDSCAIVYQSSSTVEGTAHARSDVDIYAIAPSGAIVTAPDGINLTTSFSDAAVYVIVEWVSGRRWDLEVWPATAMKSLRTKLVREVSTGTHELSHGDLEFLSRFVNGTVIRGEEPFLQFRHDVLVAGLQRALVRRFTYSAESRLDDAAGLVECGRIAEAAIQVREAYGYVVDRELAAHGDFSLSTKRRLLRLERLESRSASPLFATAQRYWAVESMSFQGPMQSWCRETILSLRRALDDAE